MPSIDYTNARPTTGEAHFTPYVQVTSKDASGIYLLACHSWPDNALQGTRMPIAAQNQTNGAPLPPSETTELDGPFTSLIDSGEPGQCGLRTIAARDWRAVGTPCDQRRRLRGRSRILRNRRATGAYTGDPPRGIALLLHGGGWVIAGPGAAESLRSTVGARGFQTVVHRTYREIAKLNFGRDVHEANLPGGLFVLNRKKFTDRALTVHFMR